MNIPKAVCWDCSSPVVAFPRAEMTQSLEKRTSLGAIARYGQVKKLANMEALTANTFKVSYFPYKIKHASADSCGSWRFVRNKHE